MKSSSTTTQDQVRASSSVGPDRLARALAMVCIALAVLLPLATLAWLARDWPAALLAALGATLPGLPQSVGPSEARLLAIAAVACVPVLLMALGLWRASRCLAAFAAGQHFTRRAVREMRACAAAVFASGLAGLCAPTASLWLLTSSGGGHGVVALSLSSQQLFLLLFAAVIWCIAGAWERAIGLAEEHAQFV